MKKTLLLFLLLGILCPLRSNAQSQKRMLYSDNAKLAKNKKLVYDFWRIILDGGQVDRAPEYLLKNYIQHNPNVPTGRQGFVNFFSKLVKPKALTDSIKADVISIIAEGDLVVISFLKRYPDPGNKSKQYTTTAFDMFRVENGKIAEHWDAETKH